MLLLAVVVIVGFTACSSNKEGSSSDTVVTTSEIATEDAKIKEREAVEFISQSYTSEELGLEDADRDYSFMVASGGVDIDGTNYIKVVANVIIKQDSQTDDGEDTFSMETLGEYYISFDGEKVLRKDMATGEYLTLENRYQDYKNKGETVASTDENN
jgi:hypothetical protein